MSLVETLLVVLIVEIPVAIALVGAYWVFHVEPKLDDVLNAGKAAKIESRLANTLAGSVLKDSRELNQDTKAAVREGVQVAVNTAAALAASTVPPSGDKLPRPAEIMPTPQPG